MYVKLQSKFFDKALYISLFANDEKKNCEKMIINVWRKIVGVKINTSLISKIQKIHTL